MKRDKNRDIGAERQQETWKISENLKLPYQPQTAYLWASFSFSTVTSQPKYLTAF